MSQYTKKHICVALSYILSKCQTAPVVQTNLYLSIFKSSHLNKSSSPLITLHVRLQVTNQKEQEQLILRQNNSSMSKLCCEKGSLPRVRWLPIDCMSRLHTHKCFSYFVNSGSHQLAGQIHEGSGGLIENYRERKQQQTALFTLMFSVEHSQLCFC